MCTLTGNSDSTWRVQLRLSSSIFVIGFYGSDVFDDRYADERVSAPGAREVRWKQCCSYRKLLHMTISKFLRTLLVTIVVTISAVSAYARESSSMDFDWAPVMEAITQVESEGDPKAVSGNSVGAMQITPILVEDCNIILEKRGEKRRYTLADRYNVKKSREMFVLIMSHYNPQNSIEHAIRLWNGGVRYSKRGTQRYYQKVMKEYAKVKGSK